MRVLPDRPAVTPSLPPPFEAIAIGAEDAFRRAMAEAEAGAGAGTLVWAQRPDLFDAAIVFEPGMELRRAWPAALVLMLAAADALDALGPPNRPVTFLWPDRISVNAGLVGGVLAAAPDATGAHDVPAWLVTGVKLRTAWPEDAEAPGLRPDRTALSEEGFWDVGAPDLLESFTRHLLHWIDLWLEEGFAAVAPYWLARLAEAGEARHGLDSETGDLVVRHPGIPDPERRNLATALRHSEWRP